jgi:hypothetical protein
MTMCVERGSSDRRLNHTWREASRSTTAPGARVDGALRGGYGREKGIEALHHYSQVKCVTIKLNRPSGMHAAISDVGLD